MLSWPAVEPLVQVANLEYRSYQHVSPVTLVPVPVWLWYVVMVRPEQLVSSFSEANLLLLNHSKRSWRHHHPLGLQGVSRPGLCLPWYSSMLQDQQLEWSACCPQQQFRLCLPLNPTGTTPEHLLFRSTTPAFYQRRRHHFSLSSGDLVNYRFCWLTIFTEEARYPRDW